MNTIPDPDLLPAGVVCCDAMGRMSYLNAQMLRWLSVETADGYLNRPFYSLLSPAGRIYFETHLRPMLMIEGKCSEISLELIAPSGERHRIYLSGRIEKDDSGQVKALHFVCSEGVDRYRYEQELLLRRRKAEAYEAMVAASPDAIINIDTDLRILTWNDAAERLLGYSANEALGRTLHPLIIADENLEETAQQIKTVADGMAVTVDTVRKHKDGSLVPVEASIARIKDERGVFAGAVSILRDITERQRNEQTIKMLNREVLHRTKNLLTVVSSMASMTAQNTAPEEFVPVFRQRIGSLANNLTLLVERNWETVELKELVSLQLNHLGPAALSQVEIDGPDLNLEPDKAEALGMAIFELSTNALKYGALSNPEGSIKVYWERNDEEENSFSLYWRETVTETLVPPTRQGFGSRLTGRMLEMALSGRVTAEFAPDGLSWRCDFVP